MNKDDTYPLVSVVTVAKNALWDLRATSESVAEQIYCNIEFIVIDGDSNDGTKDFIKKFEAITKYKSEPDYGIYDAMNKGLAIATGEWLIFLNAGDRFMNSSSISNFVAAANNKDSFVCSNFIIDGGDNASIGKMVTTKPLQSCFGIVNTICHQAVFFNRKYHPESYSTEYKICSDLDVLMKLVIQQRYTYYHLNMILVRYKGGGVSANNYKLLHKEREKIISNYLSTVSFFINKINHLRIRFFHAFK